MKLLFDENLSPALVPCTGPLHWSPALVSTLSDVFPESIYVRDVGLKSATDAKVWDYAAEMDYAIVTKDADFRQRSFLFGPPPKVIYIGLGNCSTTQIAELLRTHGDEIETFALATQEAFLFLG